ncbi:MAG TPA: tyrosine--tRNA ligase [Caldisericia bacterium]|nr:tyrosine--tRNA ligase [Caldisericia bacterium]
MEITKLIKQHTIDFINVEEFEKRLRDKKKLRIKLGADPTAPDLHLGHAVVLHKLKQFQDLGHDIVFVIGDFTAMIGDPSGRSKVRKALSLDEIKQNASTYFDQVSHILDMSKTEIRYNSEWLSKIDMNELVRIMAHFTLSQILAREDFSNRYKNQQAIFLHEFLYPMMQAYDSVAIQADVELGGSDQTFNLLLGREMQEFYGQEAQIILTMPLLVGLDGTAKMSKSLKNYIGITESAQDIFGKVMSVPDHLIAQYYEYALFFTPEKMVQIKQRLENENPMELKMELATLLASKYTREEDGISARDQFIKVFRNREKPEEWQEIELNLDLKGPLFSVLFEAGLVKSKSEAKRIIEQGGVEWEQEKITDPFFEIVSSDNIKVKVGKRSFYHLSVKGQ